MAIFRFKVGDRVVRCKQITDQYRDYVAKYGMPNFYIPNGIAGTIKEFTRNKYGKIQKVHITWDSGIKAPKFCSLESAIHTLHAIEHCETCKYRLRRLADGNCDLKSYKLSNRRFVEKWRSRLKDNKNGHSALDL